jgi:hypothetical protein
VLIIAGLRLWGGLDWLLTGIGGVVATGIVVVVVVVVAVTSAVIIVVVAIVVVVVIFIVFVTTAGRDVFRCVIRFTWGGGCFLDIVGRVVLDVVLGEFVILVRCWLENGRFGCRV